MYRYFLKKKQLKFSSLWTSHLAKLSVVSQSEAMRLGVCEENTLFVFGHKLEIAQNIRGSVAVIFDNGNNGNGQILFSQNFFSEI